MARGTEPCSVCGRFISDLDPEAIRDWYMTQAPGIADPEPYEVYTVTHKACGPAN